MLPEDDPTEAFRPLFTTQQGSILKHLSENESEAAFGLYFDYLKDTCMRLRQGEFDKMKAKTSEEVIRYVEALTKIEDIGGKTKLDLRNVILEKLYSAGKNQSPTDLQILNQGIDSSVKLVLQVLLTINLEEEALAADSLVKWTAMAEEDTFTTFINKQFPEAKDVNADRKAHPEEYEPFLREFSAEALWMKREIKIKIDCDLRNHLYYDHQNKTLFIYPLRHWLELHKRSNKNLIPDQVIVETLQSLALLFPARRSRESINYLRKIQCKELTESIGNDYPFDPPLVKFSSKICLNDFKIWHDRLAKVYSIFTGPPTSEYQKFREDFKGWFGFWGAVVALVLMTLVFGVLAITFAILAWKDAHKDAEELLDVVKELLDVVKSAVEARPETTVTVTAVRF